MDLMTRLKSLSTKAVAAVLIAVSALGFLIFTLKQLHTKKTELQKLKTDQEELGLLRDKIVQLKTQVDRIENKKTLTKVDSILTVVDDTLSPLGLKSKLKALKPTKTYEMDGNMGEEAVLEMEGLTMNELINLFYRFEVAPCALSVKKVSVKKSFDRPDLLNLVCDLLLLRPRK